MLTVTLTVREAQALVSTAQMWSAALEDVARYVPGMPDAPSPPPLVSACMRLEVALAQAGAERFA